MADIPTWDNVGIEPSNTIKTNGFEKGYRPPAEYFNWFFNRTSAALSELANPTSLTVGSECDASGQYALATGYQTTAYGDVSSAEGYQTIAGNTELLNHGDLTDITSMLQGYSLASHAEGILTTASGQASHAEGYNTTASYTATHAEGSATTASGQSAHAEGYNTTASGEYAHAEGSGSNATGTASHAEGYTTTAAGNYSHSGGNQSAANGVCSQAIGYKVTANDYNFVIGHNNKSTTAGKVDANTGDVFVIGNGIEGGAKSNAFRVTGSGQVMGTQAYTASGADYAEIFEWLDGNSNNEDRRGLFVTLDGEKIRIATSENDYILGVVSATPSIIGDVHSDDWNGKYVTDVFGARIVENGAWKLSDEFDINKDDEYINRLDRKEWSAVGMIGKLIVIDDGSCEVNGYCKATTNGIATKSDTGYRVIARIDGNHIKIVMK